MESTSEASSFVMLETCGVCGGVGVVVTVWWHLWYCGGAVVMMVKKKWKFESGRYVTRNSDIGNTIFFMY